MFNCFAKLILFARFSKILRKKYFVFYLLCSWISCNFVAKKRTMAQELTQQQLQEQALVQQQRLSQQQLLSVKMIGMPLAELEQFVAATLDDNAALERGETADYEGFTDDNGTPENEQQSAIDAALSTMESDDELADDVYFGGSRADDVSTWQLEGDNYENSLLQQAHELALSDRDRQVIDYLIGSLDDDGLLRKPLDTLADELAIYEYVEVSAEDVERVLHELQQLDPAGIGARSLQECLRLQVERMDESTLKTRMLTVVNDHYDAFTNKHWARIANAMSLDEAQMDELMSKLRRLNPKPAGGVGGSTSAMTITPDFVVYTSDDGRVMMDVNYGSVPPLTISESFEEMLSNYRDTDEHTLSRGDREAMVYLRTKIDSATLFINAINQRQSTMRKTMQAIIERQRQWFLTGDDADLKPMVLKDLSEQTGIDLSTISRVTADKYVQTRWGMIPMRHFFAQGYAGDEEGLSQQAVKQTLKELIDREDKRKPLADDALVKILNAKGYPVARRTIAKYRDQMGIPVARLRKDL